MNRKSKLTIAIATAVFAVLVVTVVYAQDKYSVRTEMHWMRSRSSSRREAEPMPSGTVRGKPLEGVTHWLSIPLIPGDPGWGDAPYEIVEELQLKPIR